MPLISPRFWTGGLRAAGILVAAVGCNDSTSPPSPTSLQIVQGPPLVGVPGYLLIDTLRVRLVDGEGRPRAGEPISWTIRLGGGTVTPLGAVTDAQGMASARWALGASGINQVEARSLLDSVVSFQTTAGAFQVERLDSGYSLACGLKTGDIWCWGRGSWVENDPVSVGPAPFEYGYTAPGLVAAGQNFTDLAVAGSDAVCALDQVGVVKCFMQSGPVNPAVPPMRVIAGSTWNHACGLTMADSTAWCWDLFAGTAAAIPSSPLFIALEMDASAQTYTACGLLPDSTAACWGDGPLGDGSFNSSPTPVPVSGGHKFAELAVGDDFACGRESDGGVWCWGRNYDGQLGIVGPDAPSPVFVTDGVTRIAAAIRTVIALRFGSVVRWGLFGLTGGGNPLTPLASVAGLPVVDFSSNDI